VPPNARRASSPLNNIFSALMRAPARGGPDRRRSDRAAGGRTGKRRLSQASRAGDGRPRWRRRCPARFSPHELVGRRLPRYEDPVLLHGNGRYVADLACGAMAMRFVRSQVARGIIRAVAAPSARG
jgi:hypothetical protein